MTPADHKSVQQREAQYQQQVDAFHAKLAGIPEAERYDWLLGPGDDGGSYHWHKALLDALDVRMGRGWSSAELDMSKTELD